MVKVCHLSSAHKRYDIRIFEKECISLSKNGYDVFFVVNDEFDNEEKEGVKIYSTKYVPKGRVERIIKSPKIVDRIAKTIDADVYHIHDPELLPLVRALKRRNKAVIYDSHEDTELQIMDKEWIPLFMRETVAFFFKKYFERVLRKCDALVSVTPAIINKICKFNSKTFMVTNYPIIDNNHEPVKNNRNTDKHIIFFAGGVEKQWCHERIIKSIEDMENVEYRIAGNAEESYIKELKQLKGWKRVNFLGKISHSQVEKEYSAASVGIAINDSTQAGKEGSLGNTKIFEIMYAGIPLICTDYRLWKEIVDCYKCGICVSNKDVNQIKKAIEYIISNDDLAREMGENGRKAVIKEYNWKTQETILLQMYHEVKEGKLK